MKSVLNILVIIGVAYFSYQWGSSKVPSAATGPDSDEAGTPSKITLYYFNGRWTTETVRLLLKYGGVEFEDKRVKDVDWPTLKHTLPFGHLPVMEENGKMAAQSIAIARYAAKKVKLTGANDWEDLEIDSIVDTLSDIKDKLVRIMEEKNPTVKEELRQKHVKETLPYYFEKLNKIAKDNDGHLAAKKLTWADFYFVVAYDVYAGLVEEEVIEKYPNLEKVRKNVLELPAVKKWMETRPETDF